MAETVKASVYNAGDLGSIPGREVPLEKEMATHSSILAWKIPWREEPGMLQSVGSQRVRHDWATSLHFNTCHFSLYFLRDSWYLSSFSCAYLPPECLLWWVFDLNFCPLLNWVALSLHWVWKIFVIFWASFLSEEGKIKSCICYVLSGWRML